MATFVLRLHRGTDVALVADAPTPAPWRKHGAPSVECYAHATQNMAALIGNISSQTHSDVFNAQLTVCTASIP